MGAITVRHLLQHTAGWDAKVSGDVMFPPYMREAAADLGVPSPSDSTGMVRWLRGKPLDVQPGSRAAYSNFGYCLLGRAFERAAAVRYERHRQYAAFGPLDIGRAELGRSRLERGEAEVRYVDYPGAPLAESVFDDDPPEVPAPYGGFALETLDSLGGWTLSVVDVVGLGTGLDGSRGRPLLATATLDRILERPNLTFRSPTETYYGQGWRVRLVEAGDTWLHFGVLDGSSGLLVRGPDGVTFAPPCSTRRPWRPTPSSARLNRT